MTDQELTDKIYQTCNELSELLSLAAHQNLHVEIKLELNMEITGSYMDSHIVIPIIEKRAILAPSPEAIK